MMERATFWLLVVYVSVVLAIAGAALKLQPMAVGSIIVGFAAGLRLLLKK